jgi:ribosomal protein L37AE/L43A
MTASEQKTNRIACFCRRDSAWQRPSDSQTEGLLRVGAQVRANAMHAPRTEQQTPRCPGCGERQMIEWDLALRRWVCAVCDRQWHPGTSVRGLGVEHASAFICSPDLGMKTGERNSRLRIRFRVGGTRGRLSA